jgi:tRNA-splicing ligase RtcB
MSTKMPVTKVSENLWEVPPTAKKGMRVPARIYATEKLFEDLEEGVFEQITNVACLPGIQKYAICMPDGHWGYGFPIGGVAAFSLDHGVISPGGIGFDINCGMRLIRTNLTLPEVRPHMENLMNELFETVPAGVGCKGSIRLTRPEFEEVMTRGVDWCINAGYGWPQDRERIEESGCVSGADASKVSAQALNRGIDQLGTLGSGNHYLEIQIASDDRIFDRAVAQALGIFGNDQIMIMVHCGSRGFGHQIGTDYLRVFDAAMQKYGIVVPDRQLACAPFRSSEGRDYYAAMLCAANTAFANRQVITHRVREAFEKILGRPADTLGLEIVYDVAHNIAKVERYKIAGKDESLLVHRKGSTRAFGPGRPEIPEI